MHVLIVLKAPAEETGKQRSPISLCLVIDRSGSMDGKKIEMTKEAACYIINWLTRRDFASIVTYSSDVKLLVPFQPLTQKSLIAEAVGQITADGCTNLSGGWLRGLSSLEENYRLGNIHRLILLTDGQANEGVTDEGQLSSMADYYRQKGITSTTLGFGEGFNEKLLQALSSSGGGNFHFVPDAEKMAGAFLSEFDDIYKVIGQNLELSVKAAEKVKIIECLSDFHGTVDENTASLNLGDVYSEETKLVLFKIGVPPMKTSPKEPLLEVDLRYDSVSGGFGAKKASEAMKLAVSGKKNGSPTPNPEVRREVVIARLAKAGYRVSELMEKGDIKGALKIVKQHIVLIDKQENNVAEQLGPEKRKLETLLDQLKRHGADQRLKKHVSTVAHSYSTRGRSRYDFPGERQVGAEILRKDQERITEFNEQVETLMEQFNHEEKMIQDMVFIINELFSNAVEYGALWCPEKPIKIECRVSSRYAKCIVEDQGPGFDFTKTMDELERNSNELRSRGRGLLVVREMADKLHFRDRGNCVEALFFRKMTSVHAQDGHLEQFQVGDISISVVPVLENGLSNEGYVAFRSEMQRLLKEGLQYVVLDLGKVRYASSVGLGLLAYLLKNAQDAGGDMVLINAGDFLVRLFRMINFHKIFKIAGSLEEAVALLEEEIDQAAKV